MTSIATGLGMQVSPSRTYDEPLLRRMAERWKAQHAGIKLVFTVGLLGAGIWGSYGFTASGYARRDAALAAVRTEAQRLRGENALLQVKLQRLQAVRDYSAHYGIPADQSENIYDIALSEGLDPALAFRLVDVESSFRRRAVSEAGAVGLTQIKPSTARWLDPSVTPERLFDTRANLRLGFRYLGLLLERYHGDMRLALLGYNRGPNRVGQLLARGRDPSNGYARDVLGEE